MAAVSRSDLQRLAADKLADAKLLLRRGRNSSAYYLAGYSVEFGLKAVIARRIEYHVLPDPAFIRDVYQHDLARLVGVAKLRVELDSARRASKRLDANWTVVNEWSVQRRYEIIDARAVWQWSRRWANPRQEYSNGYRSTGKRGYCGRP